MAEIVIGGKLTALRYPERELVSVDAARVYYEPSRPLQPPPKEERPANVLDIADITGKRIVDTRVHHSITIRDENSVAALEVMSRFAVDPRWLVYLPPTMSPSATAPEGTPMLTSLGRDAADRAQDRHARAIQQISGHVLLVEDGKDNQRLITHLLRLAGLEVSLARHGQEAIDALEGGAQPDVIVMDMQMPVMDGYTATRQLRADGHSIPIVALTAHSMQGDREACIDAGCDDYVTKPIARDHLFAVCAKHVAASKCAPDEPVKYDAA